MTVAPFDACYKAPDEASRRLARNTQLLLKHEAYLGHVADASGGSYFIEAVTDQFARAGWQTMQEIEARGGYRKAQKEIARELERQLAAREKAVAYRRRALIGTNQFANAEERALERVDERRMSETNAVRGCTRSCGCAPSGMRPQAARFRMDCWLKLAMRGCARRVRISPQTFLPVPDSKMATRRFKKAAEIAAADGDLIVLCSADEEYAAVVAELMPKLKELGRETPVIVAGNPENAEQLAAAGIADFVHVRSNAVELLTKWQKRLGIRD